MGCVPNYSAHRCGQNAPIDSSVRARYVKIVHTNLQVYNVHCFDRDISWCHLHELNNDPNARDHQCRDCDQVEKESCCVTWDVPTMSGSMNELNKLYTSPYGKPPMCHAAGHHDWRLWHIADVEFPKFRRSNFSAFWSSEIFADFTEFSRCPRTSRNPQRVWYSNTPPQVQFSHASLVGIVVAWMCSAELPTTMLVC